LPEIFLTFKPPPGKEIEEKEAVNPASRKVSDHFYQSASLISTLTII